MFVYSIIHMLAATCLTHPKYLKLYLHRGTQTKIHIAFTDKFFYFTSVFEWDSKECKQDYGKENHSYFACVKTVDNFASHIDTPIELPTFFANIQPSYFDCTKAVSFSLVDDHDPPDKFYLLHSSLLI